MCEELVNFFDALLGPDSFTIRFKEISKHFINSPYIIPFHDKFFKDLVKFYREKFNIVLSFYKFFLFRIEEEIMTIWNSNAKNPLEAMEKMIRVNYLCYLASSFFKYFSSKDFTTSQIIEIYRIAYGRGFDTEFINLCTGNFQGKITIPIINNLLSDSDMTDEKRDEIISNITELTGKNFSNFTTVPDNKFIYCYKFDKIYETNLMISESIRLKIIESRKILEPIFKNQDSIDNFDCLKHC